MNISKLNAAVMAVVGATTLSQSQAAVTAVSSGTASYSDNEGSLNF